MANKNPDNPTENVRLGEQPTPFSVPDDQLTKREARDKVKSNVVNIVGRLKGVQEDFPRVPGDEALDNLLSSVNFARLHLEQALEMVKE